MNIICPECGKIHRLRDDCLPTRRSSAKCKQCGASMIINPRPAAKAADELGTEIRTAGEKDLNSRKADVLIKDHRAGSRNETTTPRSPESDAATTRDNINEGATTAGEELYTTFPELQALSPGKFAYQKIFSPAGKRGYQTGENILKLKIVKAVHDLLTTDILQENEQVMVLAKGIAYYPFEIFYANGLLTMLSNYYAIVCTDQRVLLVNINRKINRPTRYIFQIPYGKISSIGRGAFLSSIIIASKSGRRWNFTTVRRNLAKSIRALILEKTRLEPGGSVAGDSLWQLCPACHHPLPDGLISCSHCAVAFKNPREAMLRSLILPGLGSLYLSYLPLGILEITGYLGSWLLAMLLMIVGLAEGTIMAIAPVMIYHVVTALLARKTAGKGYLPVQKP